jgi:hypothetical protein
MPVISPLDRSREHNKVKEAISSLLNVVGRVEHQPEEPTPQDLICTPGDLAILLGISKWATEDQPQTSMS